MKKIFYFTLLILINLSNQKLRGQTINSKANTKVQPLAKQSESQTQMVFRIKLDTLGVVKKDSLTIYMEFKNVSDQTIRILDLFDQMDIPFSLFLWPIGGGGTINILGPKIADFPLWMIQEFKYINIEPQTSYIHKFNLSNSLKAENKILANKTYEIRMSYVPGNGADCIRGLFESEPITISLNN